MLYPENPDKNIIRAGVIGLLFKGRKSSIWIVLSIDQAADGLLIKEAPTEVETATCDID